MTVYSTPAASEATVGTTTTSPAPFGGFSSSFVSTAAAGTSAYQRFDLDSQGAYYERRGIYIGSATNADVDFLGLYTGSAVRAASIRGNGANFLRLADVANTTPWPYTSTVALPTGWATLEVFGNSVSNTMRVLLYPAGSATATIDTGTVTVNHGSAVLTSARRGKTSGSTGYTGTLAWTPSEFRTGTSVPASPQGPLDVAANALPTGTASAAADIIGRVQLTGTAADSDGTIASVAWACTTVPSGTTARTVENPTSLTTARFYYTVAGTYAGTLTITDNSGGVTTKTWSVNAPAPSGTTVKTRKVWNGTAFA